MGLEIDGVSGIIKNTTSDGDITIKGNDGGSEISALTFDMSAAGAATFAGPLIANAELQVNGTGTVAVFEATDGAGFIQIKDDDGTSGFIGVDAGAMVFQTPGSSFSTKLSIASTGGTTITTADNTDTLTLTSTDGDNAVGPNLRLYRNSSSPANSDVLGQIDFEGRNNNSQDVVYGSIKASLSDVTDGAEHGLMEFKSMVGGTNQLRMSFDDTSVIFNQDSIDSDFRVESNGNTHMLFVDGGNNRVGIGTTPDLGAGLHIRTADSGASANAAADELVIEQGSSGNGSGLSILSATDDTCNIFFGDSDDNDIAGFQYNHANNDLTITAEASEAMRFDGKVISTGGETAADVNGGGICLNQGATDGAILTFKSTGDVVHGMTAIGIETDTYAVFKKNSADDGGLRLISMSDSNIAFKHEAFGTGENTAESAASTSNWAVDARKKNNNTVQGLAADDNLASFRNVDEAQFIIKGDGELFSNTTATVGTYDAYEDAQLVRAYDLSHMKGVIDSKFDKFVQYNKYDLQKARLIGTDEKGNATPFVNLTGMSRLHNGAIWQQYEKHQRLAEAVYEMAKETLGEDKADAILKKHDIKLLN